MNMNCLKHFLTTIMILDKTFYMAFKVGSAFFFSASAGFVLRNTFVLELK